MHQVSCLDNITLGVLMSITSYITAFKKFETLQILQLYSNAKINFAMWILASKPKILWINNQKLEKMLTLSYSLKW